MTGGFWAPIVIPIVAALALVVWLAMVYYASAHPRWRSHSSARPPQDFPGIREPLDATERKEPAGTPGPGAPPGQGGATAPRPRAPSESEQLERQSGERP